MTHKSFHFYGEVFDQAEIVESAYKYMLFVGRLRTGLIFLTKRAKSNAAHNSSLRIVVIFIGVTFDLLHSKLVVKHPSLFLLYK